MSHCVAGCQNCQQTDDVWLYRKRNGSTFDYCRRHLSAADVNESAFEVSSTAVARGNIATNVDVGSIRLEDILNEQSDDDDDGNVGNIYKSVENPPYVSPNTIDLVNDSLVKSARICS